MIKLNFDVKTHQLKNGLEILTIKKDTQISSVNVAIKVGSFYETIEQKGIAHYVEHMMFKGTKNRSFQNLNDDLEALGGEYNAYTDFSSTVYSVSCLEDELINGINILSDMVINSTMPKDEVEKERGVILAEIRATKDSVEDYSFKRINEVAFNESSLKYDVAGLEKNVKRFSDADLMKFYKEYYRANNALVTIVSSFEHEESLKMISDAFENWEQGDIKENIIVNEDNIKTKVTTKKENIELSTIIYLFTFYNLEKKHELPLRILNHRLGESANSLLFREIRENKGLAYDIYSHLDISENIKTMYIYTAVDEEDIDETIKAIEDTLESIKSCKIKIDKRDLSVMKKVHKTAVISTLEDSTELGNYVMNQRLEGENVLEFLDDMEKLNHINEEEISEVANIVLENPTIHGLNS